MHSMFSITRRRFAALAVAALALSAGACKDSTSPEAEPEVVTMRITPAGGAAVTVNSVGAVSGTLTVPAAGSRAFTVEFLNAAGQPDPVVDGSTFQVSVTPGAGITFARTGPFAGTLTAGAAGTVAVQFGLLHIEENHNDFGPFTVNVTVAAPAAVVAR
jgi:hypothetical protein